MCKVNHFLEAALHTVWFLSLYVCERCVCEVFAILVSQLRQHRRKVRCTVGPSAAGERTFWPVCALKADHNHLGCLNPQSASRETAAVLAVDPKPYLDFTLETLTTFGCKLLFNLTSAYLFRCEI